MKIKIIFLAAVLVSSMWGYGQSENQAKKNSIRTDADLRSGNYRDVLTNFFQLAFEDLTGPDKRLKFSSNLFALRLKTNPNLNIDSLYVKNTFYRNSNVDFDIKLDPNYKFNGISFGYKYAIVNRRDYTLAKDFPKFYTREMSNYKAIDDKVIDAISKKYPNDQSNLQRLVDEWNSFVGNESSIRFNQLSDELQGIVQFASTNILGHSIKGGWKFRESVDSIYKELKDSYNKKLLWTFGTNGATFPDGKMFSNLNFVTQATAGFIKTGKNSNIEFDVKAQFQFADDSTTVINDLERSVYSVQGGLNWVLRDENNHEPYFELKFAGEYNNISSGALYAGEKQSLGTFNATCRLKLTDNLWIPLQIKYDPENANVLGFLSAKFNFH